MDLRSRIKAFSKLAEILNGFIDDESSNPQLKMAIEKASNLNPWFIKEFELLAIKNIIPWLEEKELEDWTSKYCCEMGPANVGIIMAGNIPLVGFHDFLSTVICGHHAYIKMSGKDRHLLSVIIDLLIQIEPEFEKKITVTGELPETIDALIATGSNNTARYFEYFYKDIPKIIRKNRSSVAVLTGKETDEDYGLLAKDISTYFGLGCRNVSKIYVPGIDVLLRIEKALSKYHWLINNAFYASNLKFQRARYQTIEKSYVDAGCVLFVENPEFHSPVGVVNYEVYEHIQEVEDYIRLYDENIQCKVGKELKNSVPLGSTQQPDLQDYADNVDTMEFLAKLSVVA
jgi:hypothetical protein